MDPLSLKLIMSTKQVTDHQSAFASTNFIAPLALEVLVKTHQLVPLYVPQLLLGL